MDQATEKREYTSVQAGAAVILPFEKRGQYYIEPLGQIEDKPVHSFIKRLFDVTASAVALVVLCIPMLIIGVVVSGVFPEEGAAGRAAPAVVHPEGGYELCGSSAGAAGVL